MGRAISTGRIDFQEFLDIVNVPNEESYNGYRDRVSDLLVAQAGDLEDTATQRQRLYYLALLAADRLHAAAARGGLGLRAHDLVAESGGLVVHRPRQALHVEPGPRQARRGTLPDGEVHAAADHLD